MLRTYDWSSRRKEFRKPCIAQNQAYDDPVANLISTVPSTNGAEPFERDERLTVLLIQFGSMPPISYQRL